jgi:hypothetical protein
MTTPAPHPEPAEAPHPEPVEGPSKDHILSSSKDLLALHTRLRTLLLDCYAHVRAPWQFSVVGRNEIDALNADLEAVRRINAGLRHPHRSPAIARWPVPVFPPRILHAKGDLISVLQSATHLTSTALHVTERADA